MHPPVLRRGIPYNDYYTAARVRPGDRGTREVGRRRREIKKGTLRCCRGSGTSPCVAVQLDAGRAPSRCRNFPAAAAVRADSAGPGNGGETRGTGPVGWWGRAREGRTPLVRPPPWLGRLRGDRRMAVLGLGIRRRRGACACAGVGRRDTVGWLTVFRRRRC